MKLLIILFKQKNIFINEQRYVLGIKFIITFIFYIMYFNNFIKNNPKITFIFRGILFFTDILFKLFISSHLEKKV